MTCDMDLVRIRDTPLAVTGAEGTVADYSIKAESLVTDFMM